MFVKVSATKWREMLHRCSVICTIWAQFMFLINASSPHIDDAIQRFGSDQFTVHNHHQHEQSSPILWHAVTEPLANHSVQHQKYFTTPASDWVGRSAESDFNRDYFNQMNALNHKPMQSEESQVKPSISAPPLATATSVSGESRGHGQNNVYYFSPTYGNPSPATSPAGKNVPTQILAFPNRSNASYTHWPSTPSRDKILSAMSVENGSGKDVGDQLGKPVQWSIPLQSDGGDPKVANRVDYPTASYSNELNKLLMQKYYNRDLSAMTALLGKYPATEQTANNYETTVKKDPSSESTVDNGADEEYEEVTEEEEEVADDKPENVPTENVQYLRPAMEHVNEYSKISKLNNGHLKYKGRSGEILRVHGSPRVIRPYASRSMPVRLQTAHSHSVPHYYVPHGSESSGHHHLVNEKSSNWLGSGLAAGILIGAIPFGIMMASVMPTLLSTAMPIVNTATVAGKRRRRRSTDIKNLLLEQTLETLGTFLNRGFKDFVNRLTEPQPSRKNTPKNDAFEYLDNKPNAPDEVLKVMARYALAAVDEPKCIKELVCTLVASGKHSQTMPIQKMLYMVAKWIPKDIERTLGLNGLFTAIRKNSCLSTYKCPITIIDGMRKRSSSTASNARKMT